MSYQVDDRFTLEDRTSTAVGTGPIATVTHLYREPTTPPNMTSQGTGSYLSAPPPVAETYGWRLVWTEHGWLFRHELTEWNVICRAVEGKAAGRTYQELAAEFNAEGAPVWNESPRVYSVEPRWHSERVRRLVTRYAPDLQGTRTTTGTRTAPRPAFRQAPAEAGFDDSDEEFERLHREAHGPLDE